MNLGFTQIILLMVIGVLLFGNLPKRVDEIRKAAKLLSTKTKEASTKATPKVKKKTRRRGGKSRRVSTF